MSISNYLINTKRKRKILGRGIGSGKGKSCGRGQKGQKAHGKVPRAGFEGGQTPIYRRIPKFGQQRMRTKRFFQPLNLFAIESVQTNSQVLDFTGGKKPVKILAKGNLSRKIVIRANAFSEQAKKKIEQNGSKWEVITGNKPKI